jgi:Xaa-Pro aminopeptidase
MNHRGRQKNLREQLAACRLDAVLISHPPNIRYLCGFTGSAGLLLVEESGSVFFTDVRYATQSREEVEGAGVVIARKALVTALAERVAGMRKKSNQWRIGIEADHLTVAEKKRLQDLMPRRVQLRSAPPLLERARMVKDATEMERIHAAVLLGTRLFDRALEVIRPGVRENQVAAEMEYAARRAGAEEMSDR